MRRKDSKDAPNTTNLRLNSKRTLPGKSVVLVHIHDKNRSWHKVQIPHRTPPSHCSSRNSHRHCRFGRNWFSGFCVLIFRSDDQFRENFSREFLSKDEIPEKFFHFPANRNHAIPEFSPCYFFLSSPITLHPQQKNPGEQKTEGVEFFCL